MSHQMLRARSRARFASILCLLALGPAVVAHGSETVTYKYDALGRLVQTHRSGNVNDGIQTNVKYDAAGNRSSYEVAATPGIPPSIDIPGSSTTGSYPISWGKAAGTVTEYELYEATNSSFSDERRVYSGTGTSKLISGSGNGKYYYRVHACNGSACSDYRTGGNAVTVTLPPSVPPSISVPVSSTTSSFPVSWGKTTGTLTAYELYQATNSSFSGQVRVYSGTAISKSVSVTSDGTYYYRVRACNGPVCSGYRAGANATTVTLRPSVPPSISVPSGSSTGSYTISWGKSTGTGTRYELYQATNSSFSGQTRVYNDTGTSKVFSGKGNGTYYYRVRACNGTVCSGYRTGANGVTVQLPIKVLNPSISVTTTGQLTSITTLANLNGNPATIHSFVPQSCPNTSAQIQSGGQSVKWSNGNYYIMGCEIRRQWQCSASYVIRNSNTGQLHSGTAAVTVSAQANPAYGGNCP